MGHALIEVTHGDGLGGKSVNYGFPAASDEEYLSAVCREVKQTRVSALLLPGIGTVDHLKMAVDCGISTIRVATHCTEADVSEQHISIASQMDGLDTVGFLMMAHMIEPEELLVQLKLMESYGANCVYITDSAGYMRVVQSNQVSELWIVGKQLAADRAIRFEVGHMRICRERV